MRNIAIKELDVFFKERGWKKRGIVWYYKNNDISILCEYQGAKIFNGFYLNFGLYFHSLSNDAEMAPKSDKWHFEGRYNQVLNGFIENPEGVVVFEDSESSFLEKFGKIKANIDNYILPYLMQMNTYSYFKDNYPENFNSDKLWIKNITSKHLKDFIEMQISL